MQGIRFYLDHETPSDKRKGVHTGNVTAVFIDSGFHRWVQESQYEYCYEAIGAVLFSRNSPVCGTTASWEWLRTHAKRISEAMAREIHPELFKRLDH